MSFQSFRNIFCGCFVNESKPTEGEIDENSRLIPSVTDPSSPSLTYNTVDQNRLRERLGTVVRAKEGKMVNVYSRTSFNLHNPGTGPSDSTLSLPDSTRSLPPNPMAASTRYLRRQSPSSSRESVDDPAHPIYGARLVEAPEKDSFAIGDLPDNLGPSTTDPDATPKNIVKPRLNFGDCNTIALSWGD